MAEESPRRHSGKTTTRNTSPTIVPFSPVPTVDSSSFDGLQVEVEELRALKSIVEGTAHSTGEDFFESLVRQLATMMRVDVAFVCEFTESRSRVQTLAFYEQGKLLPRFEWNLVGTPCQAVLEGNLCHYPCEVNRHFPLDSYLTDHGITSYLGVPLVDGDHEVMGHLAIADCEPMPEEPRQLFTFHIFAARAAAELERIRAEQRLAESERRYRDLYEHAPVGNLSTGPDGRFVSVSDRAAEWLGYPVDEIVGKHVSDVMADTPAGKPRGLECLQKFLSGEEVDGVELELRAKDGRSVWVNLFIRPILDAAGQVLASRSVWINITDRVLAEREKSRLHRQNLLLQQELKSVHNFEEIIGTSAAIRGVLERVRRVAATDSTVLITGETGTGKELIARAIHSHSRRRDKPIVKLNCAALPSGLVESELFGHEKGAFTGALARKLGRFELADGGTMFLDEIGELPAEAQAKLLRVLQEQEFERVGGVSGIKVDVRLIAATNRDLQAAVAEGAFREDLFFRLNVFPISVPPLRDRIDDVPLLLNHLVQKFVRKIGRDVRSIDATSVERLQRYDWPGNIRELENIIERAVILNEGAILTIGPDVLPLPGTSSIISGGGPIMSVDLKSVERLHILNVLEQTRWVIDGPRGAARILQLKPSTLRSRMKKLRIERAT